MAAEALTISDGRRLDVYVEGPDGATPLVFHCGTPGSGLPFPALVHSLTERGLRYVSWSRPGYGASTRQKGRNLASVVDDTIEVLDALGVDSAWMLGWSGGGPHALACAALMPDRVRGTALIGCLAPYDAVGLDFLDGMGQENIEEFSAALEGPDALIGFKEQVWPSFRQITAPEIAAALGDLVDDVDRSSISGGFAEWLAAIMQDGLRQSYWGWFDDDMLFVREWGFDLASIPGPVHIWHGAHDRMVPFAHAAWLADHVGSACPHLFEDHGHLTLIVDTLPRILDELIAPDGRASRG
jgi:pimeloyl-ACP methyl ester carboxylesterase